MDKEHQEVKRLTISDAANGLHVSETSIERLFNGQFVDAQGAPLPRGQRFVSRFVDMGAIQRLIVTFSGFESIWDVYKYAMSGRDVKEAIFRRSGKRPESARAIVDAYARQQAAAGTPCPSPWRWQWEVLDGREEGADNVVRSDIYLRAVAEPAITAYLEGRLRVGARKCRQATQYFATPTYTYMRRGKKEGKQ